MKLAVAYLLVLLPVIAEDAITFTPSTSMGVTNYTLYYGPYPSRDSTNGVHLGLDTVWPITGIPSAQSAFFFATAWADGVESDPSNEIVYTNFETTIQIKMILEKSTSPGGPYTELTNQLNYFAAMEGGGYYRVRMEAINITSNDRR